MCQEVGRRSKKILQDYLNTMIGQGRCKMKQMNEVMIHKMKMVHRPTAKHLKKVPKTPEFVHTDSDDTNDEQGPAAKQLQKATKTSGFVDTDLDDSDDEQEPVIEQLQKAPKPPGFVDTGTGEEQEQ